MAFWLFMTLSLSNSGIWYCILGESCVSRNCFVDLPVLTAEFGADRRGSFVRPLPFSQVCLLCLRLALVVYLFARPRVVEHRGFGILLFVL